MEASASCGLFRLEGGRMLIQRPELLLGSACGFLVAKDKCGIWMMCVFYELEQGELLETLAIVVRYLPP